ncbi:MAG: class I SAM-dependent methyltransferase [Chloroflexi bacterium]|nr:class I SAM-dependent methyltransferase [Chloroflexota bacterium]
MCASIDRRWQDKRRFYAQRKVSQNYDELRFGGPSGEWVNRRELSLIQTLLPPTGQGAKVLDLGCGTGRLSLHLRELGYDAVAVDSSAEMLAAARAKPGGKQIAWLQGDAGALPLAARAFDAVVALRMAFHFPDLRLLLGAAIGVVKSGGRILFDTYNWSPRAWAPLGQGTWGARIYVHHPDQVQREARGLGLDVVETRACFLFSPYVYRLLPLPIVQGLYRLEAIVPAGLRARTFWHLQVGDPTKGPVGPFVALAADPELDPARRGGRVRGRGDLALASPAPTGP